MLTRIEREKIGVVCSYQTLHTVDLIQILARHQKNRSCMFIPNPTYSRFDSNSCKTPTASHKVTTCTDSHLPTHNTVAKMAQFWVRFIQNGTQNCTSREIFAKCSARIAPGYTAAKMVQFWEQFVQNGTQNQASKKPLLFVVIFWPHHCYLSKVIGTSLIMVGRPLIL